MRLFAAVRGMALPTSEANVCGGGTAKTGGSESWGLPGPAGTKLSEEEQRRLTHTPAEEHKRTEAELKAWREKGTFP